MSAQIALDDVRRTITEAVTNAISNTIRSPWLDNEAAAGYLSCTPGTMKTWRARGEGPRYHIINSKLVRYNVDDLDSFISGEAGR